MVCIYNLRKYSLWKAYATNFGRVIGNWTYTLTQQTGRYIPYVMLDLLQVIKHFLLVFHINYIGK